MRLYLVVIVAFTLLFFVAEVATAQGLLKTQQCWQENYGGMHPHHLLTIPCPRNEPTKRFPRILFIGAPIPLGHHYREHTHHTEHTIHHPSGSTYYLHDVKPRRTYVHGHAHAQPARWSLIKW